MKLVPLSDRVVLKQCEAEETTKSGIILNAISGNHLPICLQKNLCDRKSHRDQFVHITDYLTGFT